MKYDNPVDVSVKFMTSSRNAKDVFDFFSNVKNWESGGIISSAIKDGNDRWICDTPAGRAKIICIPDKDSGILDHNFIVGNVTWNVYVRVVPNNNGSTTLWTFLKPDGLSAEQFQEQLKGFDSEIDGWRRALENGV